MSAARVNRVFIAVCDRVGAERGVEWVGGTAVIDESGWIAGGGVGGHRPRPWLATRSSRAFSDAFADRRPELYGEVTAAP